MKQKTAKPAAKGDQSNPRREFFVAATNMSWQLAVVVLVPIIGGFRLDEKLNTLPGLTIAGFFIAMAGMGLVVWRQLRLLAPPSPPASPTPPISRRNKEART